MDNKKIQDSQASTSLEVSDPLTDCKICTDLWRRFSDPSTIHEIDLVSVEAALSSNCQRHTPLISLFKNSKRHNLHFIWWPGWPDFGIKAGGHGESVKLTKLTLRPSSSGGIYDSWDLLLVRRDGVPGHAGTGHVLDPDWVDLDVVKRWKARCLSSHGSSCENPMKLPPTRPAILIDVEDKCLVSGQSSHGGFVALSYRWGKHTEFRVNVDNLTMLQKRNALEHPYVSPHLTPIIRHAMYLTAVLGERYLWIDALCIYHGDEAAMAQELSLMGAIYAGAVVTIVAADGDAQYGLRGLKGISSPREMEQQIIPFGEEKLVVRNIGNAGPEPQAYYERGWTYQEYQMAPRKLVFVDKELHWECQHGQWHEEMTLGTECDKDTDHHWLDLLAGFPDINSLGHIISNYNKRKLTYAEDALPGISGMLSLISRSFDGGFLYGLPEMYFDRALTWSPHGKSDLQRRAPSDQSSSGRMLQYSLPSWSWVGWQGNLSHRYAEATRVNLRSERIEETVPITEWYTSSNKHATSLRRIRSTWYENRDRHKDFTKPLPAGWTRHEDLREEPRLYPDGCGGYLFRHRNMTANPNSEPDSWFYPFPVTSNLESAPVNTPEQTPFLYCQTRRAHLRAGQTVHRDPTETDMNSLDILEESGPTIGRLQLHNESQLKKFPRSVEGDLPRVEVELVAVHRTKWYWKESGEQREQGVSSVGTSEVYNVLWIEWTDGVAYRLASGWVAKSYWEASDLEDVSLILG